MVAARLLHQRVARAAVREALDGETVAPNERASVGRAVARARVGDEQLDLAVELLRGDGGEPLPTARRR